MEREQSAEADSHEFNQDVPPLYVHIREVLQEYPDGQIFKEIIQNADDAGARTVSFYLDNRQHGTHSLVHGGLARFQGPALLAYNDAQFTQEDWKGIQSFKLSVKKEDPFKVGKFGIGFNSVYHVTDLPTILSGSTLAFLEPHKEVWKGKSGRKFTLTECHWQYRQSLDPFDDVCGFYSGISTFPGTIFRFPLRDTPSKLSDKVYTVDKLRELTDALKSDAKLLLLFLRSVDTIEVHEIGRNGRHKQAFRVAISERDRMHVHQDRKRFIERLRAVHRQQSYGITQRLDLDIDCHVQVVNSLHVSIESHWIVTTQVGCPEQDVLTAAGRQHNLPWVGAAMEVTDHPTQENGRIFCFLPLPSDASSNLPVHLNGTFGLSSNRRMLKWTGSESRNDPEAQWNELLVRHLIPPCYERLLMLAKQYLTADQFYQAWPKVSSVRYTPWEKLLFPLFQSLFQRSNLWVGPPLRQWITPQQGVFIPEHNSEFPEVVKRALASCRVKVVSIPQVIWEALHYSDCHVTTVTPSYTRRAIRSKTSSYSSFRSKEKQKLLSYCLSDANYSDIQGLALLQMANGTYATFQLNSMLVASLYICSNDIPRSLLPNLDNLLVDLSRENPKLHDTLQKVADSKATQLQHLSVQTLAQLLPSCMPVDWQSRNTVSLPSNAYPLEWFQTFWEWIERHYYNLMYFEGQLVVPVSTGAGQRQFNVTRLSRDSAVVYLPRSVSCHPDLRQAITKLQVKITNQTDFPYIRHHQLLDYLYMYTADGVLSAIACAYKGRLTSLQNVSLTKKEASKLCSFLSSTRYYIDDGQKQVLCYLPMYTALEQNELFSIKQASRLSWGGKAIVEPEAFDTSHSCLPSNLIILSRSSQVPLLTLTQRVQTPTKVELILNTLYPMIRSGCYPDSQIDELMVEILRVIPTLRSYSQRNNLVISTGNLCFIQTSDGTRRSPKDLFDPSIADLKALYQGEPVFPLAPFDDKELRLCLRACGLQTTVKGQQIISVMESICVKKSLSPVLVGRVKFTRAKAVLKYLSSCDKQFFSEKVIIPSVSHRHWYPLSQAISLLSSRFNCLPVCNKPPKSFPSCLVWKGRAYTSHFVTLTDEVLLPRHDSCDTLPCITGTQMYVVDCNLSSDIYDYLTSSTYHTVTRRSIAVHVWSHFKLVIQHRYHMSGKELDAVVSDVYDYLEKHSERIPELFTGQWIWIRKHHTFVCPDVASLSGNPSFHHSLEPYLYIIPETLVQDYSALFRRHGITNEMTRSQIVSVLGMIKDRERPEVDGKKAMNMVLDILNWLTDDGETIPEVEDGDTLYVPVQTTSDYPKLVEPERAVYTDSNFLQEYLRSADTPDDYDFVDRHIGIEMARKLGVTPLSDYLQISDDTFEDVGQHEPLITRLKNILQDYRDGVTIMKELLQNADDAEATEVNICYDARTHTVPPKSLLYAGMAKCHGPALVVHNNASFTEDDFVNITRLAGETKMDKPLKIGKFGVGFCSVYHITDIPCFVSQDMLYIFDPTMSHLGKEIRDAARPGKKIRFTDEIIISSNQLLPFVELYGFDKRKSYHGTIFRFPFRTSPSDISNIVYNESMAVQLLRDIHQSSSSLLLFLQNIQRITFSQINPGECTPRVLLDIRRSTVTNDPVSIHTIETSCHWQASASDTQERWLVATQSDSSVQFGLKNTYATASVACVLESASCSSNHRGHRYIPKAVNGEVFCFLPLAVHSGLPVHVSSNFAVMKSRKGIQASSDPSEMLAQFNVGLMEHIVPKAYCILLKTLQAMCKEGQVAQEAYQFFSLWPLEEELRTHNPWDRLIAPLYQLISSNELFFSESTCKWFTLSGSEFLAPGILSTESTIESIPNCVIKVIQVLLHNYVDLPESYRTHLPQGAIDNCTLDERMFLDSFFGNIPSLKPNQDTKNEVLKYILYMYGHVLSQSYFVGYTDQQQYLEEALRNNRCVPCSPDGKVLKHCMEVVDPNAPAAKLYDPEDHVFPVTELCKNSLILTALSDLGMIKNQMPWHMLVERAQTVKTLYQSDQTRALERAQLIIQCMGQNLSHQLESSLGGSGGPEDLDFIEGLESIPFLPVLKKPKDYPVQWCGDGCGLLSGQELLHSSQRNVRLAGSQLPIVCTKSPREGGCGRIPSHVRQQLGITEHPDSQTVTEQLYEVISKFSNQQTAPVSADTRQLVDEICSDIYNHLNSMLEEGTINTSSLNQLKCQPCIWVGGCFTYPNLVARNWSHSGPYLHPLPHTMGNTTKLINALDICENFELDNFLSALKHMHEDFLDHPLSQKCLQVISVIVQGLDTSGIPDGTVCFLPDEKSIMCHTSQLSYNDAPWCQVDENHRFVNEKIPREAAIKLGVKPVRSKLLERYESSSGNFAGVPFGQRELLTQRIKNILTQYPCDETILKELLQNADDAKATKMYVILDRRTHGKKMVPKEEWADLQGPALLVWNDSVFEEKDLQGIQELGLGSKRSEEESIGQYGIGFNVVYNITDCPSFITYCDGETLCVLDPHCRYVPGADEQRPGRQYNKLDDTFWSNYADLKAPYLREGVTGCPPEVITSGSLFRFPLRSTQELVDKSDLVDKDSSKAMSYSYSLRTPASPWRMHERLKKWANEVKPTLFFLNHVTEIKIFVIEESVNKMSLINWCEANLSQEAQTKREALHGKVKAFGNTERDPQVIYYPLTITERSPGMQGKQEENSETWLIQQGVGDLMNRDQEWKFTPQVKPKHGIAAPLQLTEETKHFRGIVFCFLPLPIHSHLPVHVNGNFILDSSRRDLWHSTREDDPDDRTKWNRRLIEAIASSYVHLLVSARHFYVPQILCRDISKLFPRINHFYNVFPVWLLSEKQRHSHHPPEGLFLILARAVYEKLKTKNSSVIVTIKMVPVRDSTTPSYSPATQKPSKAAFTAEWHALYNEEEPSNQVYFWRTSDKELTPILKSIGMKLSAAPLYIRNHFTSLEIKLPKATSDTVFQYYSQFHHQVSPTGGFPCHISDTAFKSVQRFQKFTKFLLDMPDSVSTECEQSGFLGNPFSTSLEVKHSEFPGDPFGLPLVLTADDQLRALDKNNLIICSDHLKLFPHSKEVFLHPTMLSIKYKREYFVQPSDENWPLVSGILQGALPISLKAERVLDANTHINMSTTLKQLWSCLSGDVVFGHHLKAILGTWALLPSTRHQVFAFSSFEQLLPVIAPETKKEQRLEPSSSHASDDKSQAVFRVLQQAGMPVLDTSVVQHDTVRSYCPTFSTPSSILTNLYHLHKVHTEEEGLTTERVADSKIITLFEYFKHIHFAQDHDSLCKLKSLPFFKDVTGKLRTLEGSSVYIWPRHICSVGSNKWLAEIPAVFLKKDGGWSKLEVDPKVLGIQHISVLDVYSEFIFPCFNLLSTDEKYKQLEHIRSLLFDDAKNDTESKDDEKSSIAIRFINGLETLPCLPLPDGKLRPVREFSDPTVPIFTTFHESFFFPPPDLQSTVWLEFFRKIGLRRKVTCEEYEEFCWKVSNGDHHEIKEASRVLLKYLMKAKEWYSEATFMRKVSNVAFVCPEPLQQLNWIAPIYQAENRIQQGRKTIDLTYLNGAGLDRESTPLQDCESLLWTVKPIVRLPKFEENTPLKVKNKVYRNLGVVTVPSPCDVVANVVNISRTRFANFALFDKYTDDCKRKQEHIGDSLLLTVLRDSFRFLHHNSRNHYELKPLREVPCIPVCADGGTVDTQHPVLVTPLQVIADRSTLNKAHPFINRLPHSLYPYMEVLFMIGVESALKPIHVRVALETIHAHVKQPLDLNTAEVVKYLIKKLYSLLKDVSPADLQSHADSLSPLFLPNADCQLVRTAQLICNDMRQYRNVPLDFSGLQHSLFDLLVSNPRKELGFTPAELCRCLPSAVSPVLLSSCCEQQLHDSCTETVSNTYTADGLQRTFALHVWIAKAAELILQNTGQVVAKQKCSKFTASLQDFLQRTEIVVYRNLEADIYLTLVTPKRKIGSAPVKFLIDKTKEGAYHLCLDQFTPLNLLDSLASSIMACVAQLSGVDPKTLGNPEGAIKKLLMAKSPEDIDEILDDFEIPPGSLSLEGVDIPISSQRPKLGDPIPTQWHDQLDQDINNIFRPEDLVGYEERDGHIVLARVIHRIQPTTGTEEEEEEEEEGIARYFIITRENEEGKIVSVLDLYKFKRIDSDSAKDSREVAILEDSDASCLATSFHEQDGVTEWKKIKEEICANLRRIWRLPQDDRRKGIKRLYLKWHPDKNSHPLATKAFQFLKQQISRLEAGLPLDHDVEEKDCQVPSSWRPYWNRWDDTAYQHSQSRGRGGGHGGGAAMYDEMRPKRDVPTAKVWLCQAEVDMRTLQTVLAQVDNFPDHSALTCFLAHEVAEKALKAGKYATSGLPPEGLVYHDLVSHAGGLEDWEPGLTIGLRTNAQALRNYYLWTRYPNKYTPPSVPADHFTPDQARDAHRIAEKILQMMRAVVEKAQQNT